jgi:hypothetical protein
MAYRIFCFFFAFPIMVASWGESGSFEKVTSAEELEAHFKAAQRDLTKKDARAASAEIRRAAVFVRTERILTEGEIKTVLIASANELKNFASEIERGDDISPERIGQVFARAHNALAKFHCRKAAEFWFRGDAKLTGYNLEGAAAHLQYALLWAGIRVKAGGETAINDARSVSRGLIKGLFVPAGEVSNAIDEIDKEIEEVVKQTNPGRSDRISKKGGKEYAELIFSVPSGMVMG